MKRNPLSRRERAGIMFTAATAFLSVALAFMTSECNRRNVRLQNSPATHDTSIRKAGNGSDSPASVSGKNDSTKQQSARKGRKRKNRPHPANSGLYEKKAPRSFRDTIPKSISTRSGSTDYEVD